MTLIPAVLYTHLKRLHGYIWRSAKILKKGSTLQKSFLQPTENVVYQGITSLKSTIDSHFTGQQLFQRCHLQSHQLNYNLQCPCNIYYIAGLQINLLKEGVIHSGSLAMEHSRCQHNTFPIPSACTV